MKFSADISTIKGVGESRAKGFNSLGINTVGELLRYYPRTYEDWSSIIPISQCVIGENACIKARVMFPFQNERVRNGMIIAKSSITDGESVLSLTFFNNKYISKMLKEGEEYLFFGKVTLGRFNAKEMISPAFVKLGDKLAIRPIYPQNSKITSKTIQMVMKNALDATETIADYLPDSIIERYKLISLDSAIRQIHFPDDDIILQKARDRLIFDELFILQLSLLTLKGDNSRVKTENIIRDDYSEEFYSLLPFEPTSAQKKAVSVAIGDMQSGKQMNRLLQGDVGSGKTAVAATLVHSAAKNGMQSALMAPTEVLANQHYETFLNLFEGSGISCALLTGNTKASEKKQIKEKLKKGEINLAIGTHALIQDDVEFDRLGLVITDEQHRFGVKQRTGLCSKGENPHVYVMSATPIPRTLALMVFGDLDISVLDELPPGRQKIETYSVDSSKRGDMFGFIKKKLDEGRQAYIVCPLVEKSEAIEKVLDVEDYYERASGDWFREYSIGLLHGKMTPKEKDRIMSEFKAGKIQLLVSTVVIEVGVDVPNAAIMVVENAERFGLSQLHQLRGRVGRGKEKSYCILVTDTKGEVSKTRMQIMCSTTDGFKIADEDLKLRGPGDFFGTRQHGLPKLRIADIMTDTRILTMTQELAVELLKDDAKLEKDENIRIGKMVRRKISSLNASAANTI
ncbi:MAG: ATP-dependent DNA helicase RecG [Clostridiales bacterium]|nr:ATP-dependent DNA helicase RecG [Clostridiales bacterium]